MIEVSVKHGAILCAGTSSAIFTFPCHPCLYKAYKADNNPFPMRLPVDAAAVGHLQTKGFWRHG